MSPPIQSLRASHTSPARLNEMLAAMNSVQFSRELRIALLVLTIHATMASAADFNAKITDVFGRPVPDAIVKINWLKRVSKDDVREIDLATLASDWNGIVKGTYDE